MISRGLQNLGGCKDYVEACNQADRSTAYGQNTCSQATAICRSLVEGPHYEVSGRNTYDIRANESADIPPSYWVDYINLASTQDALGVSINYTSKSSEAIWEGFSVTGDFVYPDFLEDLENMLDKGVSIHLLYGDAVSYPRPHPFISSFVITPILLFHLLACCHLSRMRLLMAYSHRITSATGWVAKLCHWR